MPPRPDDALTTSTHFHTSTAADDPSSASRSYIQQPFQHPSSSYNPTRPLNISTTSRDLQLSTNHASSSSSALPFRSSFQQRPLHALDATTSAQNPRQLHDIPQPARPSDGQQSDAEADSNSQPRLRRRRVDWNEIFFQKALSTTHQLAFLKQLTPGDRLSCSWIDGDIHVSHHPPKTTTWTGTIVGVKSGIFEILYDEDASRCVRHLPVEPETGSLLILELGIVRDAGLRANFSSRVPPATFCSSKIAAVPDMVIFYDGGYNHISKEMCLAVFAKIYQNDGESITLCHAAHSIGGTNNIAEHAALLGALSLAEATITGKSSISSNPNVNVRHIAIVGDSLLTLHQASKIKTVRARQLVAMVNAERELIAAIQTHNPSALSLHHVLRHNNKDADRLGRECMASKGQDFDASIFKTSLDMIHQYNADGIDSTPHESTNDLVEDPADTDLSKRSYTLDEIAYIRTFPCRATVPPEAAGPWGKIVVGAIAECVQATTEKQRRDAFARLLVLPSLYLPTHISSRKLLVNLISQKPNTRRITSLDRRDDAEDRRINTAIAFARKGFVKKSLRTLAPAKLADITDEAVKDKLTSKYISRDRTSIDEAIAFDPDNLPPISPAIVKTAVRKMNLVAASGMDRWNGALLLAALANDDCAPALCALLIKMLRQPAAFSSFATTARGIALTKPNGDVRPIGIPSFFIKLLATVCLEMDAPKRLLPTWQHGFDTAGCHNVIAQTRKQHEDGFYILATDITNAFNSISRDSVMQYLTENKQRLPFIAAYYNLCYVLPSTVMFQINGNDWMSIVHNDGMRQGDPVTSFIFDGMLGDALAPLATQVSANPSSLSIAAIHDDVKLAARSPDDVLELFSIMQTCLAPHGLTINQQKCTLLCPVDTPQTLVNSLGHTIPTISGASDSMRIVGAHIGARETTLAFLQEKLQATTNLVAEVIKVGRHEPRVALAQLKFSCQMKLRYIFENHRPDLTAGIALQFEECLRDALEKILGFTPIRDLIYSSLGLGMMDYVKHLPIIFDRANTNQPKRHNGQSICDTLAEARTAEDASVLARFPHLKARVASLAAATAFSTSCLSTFEPHGAHATKHDIISMFRLLLLAERRSKPCPCGLIDKADGSFIEHVWTCSFVRGANRTYRHNIILATLDYNLRRFGCITSVEPTMYQYDDGSKKKPDICCLGSPPITTDLVISCDVDDALKGKLDKHRGAVNKLGHEFIPIGISIFGELHKSVHSFLKKTFASLEPGTKYLAILETKRAIAEAWMIGSIAMLQSVADDKSWHADGTDVESIKARMGL